MEYDERIWTTYEERVENAKRNYEPLDTVTLWNEFVAADNVFMEYLYGRNFSGSIAALPVESNRERAFFESTEDSMALLQLLKMRDRREIRGIYKDLKAECRMTYGISKEHIGSLIGLIEEEFGIRE